MKMNTVFTLFLGLFAIFQGQHIFAAQCNLSNTTYSYSKTMTASGSNWITPTESQIEMFSLVNCQNQISNNEARYKVAFFDLGSHINFSQSITDSGTTYRKLVNTGDAYLNKYGYVSFSLRYANNAGTPFNKPLAQKVDFFTGAISSGYESATQGVTIVDLKFYFTAAPATAINANVILGAIDLTVSPNTNNNPSHTGRKNAQITLNIAPETGKTCSLNSPIVTLPTVSTNTLPTTGNEVGRTNFSITTTCSGLANKPLYFMMLDNGNVANNGTILTNTTNATNNVGIKIYDASNNTAITYKDEYSFGTLGTGASSPVTKNFYAKYYKRDNNSVSAGTVNGQATVLVVYK